MAYIQTWGRGTFSLTRPLSSDVDVVVIAHALSGINRFTGHGPAHYSVAQHCVLASRQVPRELALAALLHDAAEAYVGDTSSPMKKAMRAIWLAAGQTGPDPQAQVEAAVERAICDAMGVPQDLLHHPLVVEADMRMVVTERRDGLGDDVPPPEGEQDGWPNVEPYFWRIVPWRAEYARCCYLDRLEELRG